MAYRYTDTKQRLIDLLVHNDLKGVLEAENPGITSFWAQKYVLTAGQEGPAVDMRMPEVVQMFGDAGFTVSGYRGKPYKGDAHSNIVQNTLVALAKGELPNFHSLSASPQANAELEAIQRGPATRKPGAAYKL